VRLVAFFVVLSSPLIGCFPVHVSPPQVKRQLVASHTNERELDGRVYAVELRPGSSLDERGDALKLSLTVEHAKRCERLRTDTWQTTTTVERSSKAGTILLFGTALTAAFTAGVVTLARAKPSSDMDTPAEKNERAWAGMGILLGWPGPLLLIEGTIDAVGSIDSVDTRYSQERQRSLYACRVVPFGGALVELLVDGQVISTRRAGADGSVAFELARAELSQRPSELSLRVEREAASLSPDGASLFRNVLARWNPQTQPRPEARLCDVPLATATRERLEAALESQGCHWLSNENRNVAHYDAGCVARPGFEHMKVLYDGESRLVRVKLSGEPEPEQLDAVERALDSTYGAGRRVGTSVTWNVPDGFTLELSPAAAGWQLSYVNAALDAELRRDVERRERQQTDSTD